MSDPLSDTCVYCGSPDVLDDAWWCGKPLCWLLYYKDAEEEAAREARTPLTYTKACRDLMDTKANVWGTPYMAVTHTIDKLLARVYVNRCSHVVHRI